MQILDWAIFMFLGVTGGQGNNGVHGHGFSENTKSEVVCITMNDNIQEVNMLVSILCRFDLEEVSHQQKSIQKVGQIQRMM